VTPEASASNDVGDTSPTRSPTKVITEETAVHRATLVELDSYDEEVVDPVARREVRLPPNKHSTSPAVHRATLVELDSYDEEVVDPVARREVRLPPNKHSTSPAVHRATLVELDSYDEEVVDPVARREVRLPPNKHSTSPPEDVWLSGRVSTPSCVLRDPARPCFGTPPARLLHSLNSRGLCCRR
jgi:hypothetical protein